METDTTEQDTWLDGSARIPPHMCVTLIFVLFLVFGLAAFSDAAAKPTKYTYKTIDIPFPQTFATYIRGTNKHKVKVGTYDNAFGLMSFRGSNGKYTMHPLLAIQAINASGATAGWYWQHTPYGTVQSGFLNTGTSMATIHLPGMHGCSVEGLNDQGYVVGYCYDSAGYHAFFQRPDGSYEVIDPPADQFPGGDYFATGINRHTEIVGGTGYGQGWFYDGTWYPLDVPGATWTRPYSINGQGTIAGTYCVNHDCAGFKVNIRNEGHWSTFQRISVPGSLFTEVFEIVDDNEVVGGYYGPDGVTHGFVGIPTK